MPETLQISATELIELFHALTGMLRMGKIGFQPDDGNDDACTGEVQVYAMYRLP